MNNLHLVLRFFLPFILCTQSVQGAVYAQYHLGPNSLEPKSQITLEVIQVNHGLSKTDRSGKYDAPAATFLVLKIFISHLYPSSLLYGPSNSECEYQSHTLPESRAPPHLS